MKIKKKSLVNIGIFIILFIVYTKSFYKAIYGGNKGVIFTLSIGVLFILFGIFRKKTIKINKLSIMWVFVLIIALSNNYDLKNNNLLAAVQIIIATIYILILQNDDEWCEKAIKYINYFSLFYLFTGIILLFFKGFLISKIVPLFNMEDAQYYYDSIISQINSGFMTGLTSHYSIMGIYLSIGMCSFTGKAFLDDGKISFKKCGGIILMLVGSILSGKRSSLLFPLLSIFISYILFFKPKDLNRRLTYIMYIMFGILVGITFLTLIPNIGGTIGRIIEVIGSNDLNVLTNKRYDMLWLPAIKLFEESPLFGIGWGNFKYSFTRYYLYTANQNNVHNVYLQVLCETGIIGFLIIFGTIFFTINKTGSFIKKWRNQQLKISDKDIGILEVSFVIQLYFLLYSLTGNPLYDIHIYLPYMISVAMSIAVMNKIKKEEVA